MKQSYIREWLPLICFFTFSLLLELFNFLSLDFGILPTYILLDISFLFVICSLFFLLPSCGKIFIIFSSLALFLQAVLNIVNNTIYNMLGEIFSLSMLNLGSEGLQAFELNFIDVKNLLVNLFIVCIYIALMIYFYKLLPKSYFTKKSKFVVILSCFIALQSFGIRAFSLQRKNFNSSTNGVMSDQELWDSNLMRVEAFKRFGTFGFYIKDIKNHLNKDTKLTNDVKLEIDLALLNGEKEPNSISQYHGVGENDNLIIILLESFDSFAIDPINTPYIWNLVNEKASYFTNFHGKNKTNVSEAISFVGNTPYEQLLYHYYLNAGINTPFALTNVMKNKNSASVNFFHGYSKGFYKRDYINKSLGFDNVYGLEDCTLTNKSQEWGDWVLDSEYVSNMIDKMIPENQNFMTYYTSITTHGPYDGKNERLKDNIQYVKDNFTLYANYVNNNTNFVIPNNENDKNTLINYKASCKDTDDMVKIIFDRLESLNILDKTTVVLLGDHYAFYEDIGFKTKNVSLDNPENPILYNLPLIIYNDKLPSGFNNSFCTTHDVYPTICDIMNIRYNSAIIQGYSIFSDDIKKSVLASFQNGIFTDKLFTYDLTDIDIYDSNVTNEEIGIFKESTKTFYKKQELIEKIYNYNYFKYTDRFNYY